MCVCVCVSQPSSPAGGSIAKTCRTTLGPTTRLPASSWLQLEVCACITHHIHRSYLVQPLPPPPPPLVGVDHDEVVKLAEKHFSSLPSNSDLPPVSPCRFTGSEVSTTSHSAQTTILHVCNILPPPPPSPKCRCVFAMTTCPLHTLPLRWRVWGGLTQTTYH